MACQNNELETCQAMLLRWGRQYINENIRDLAALDRHLAEGELKKQLTMLRFQQFQRDVKPWLGDELYVAFKQYRHPQSSENAAALPPLYPQD
jgi:hypothetical protein